MKNLMTPLPAPPFVTAGPWIVLSGQVGVDADWQPVTGGIQDEMHAAFANVRTHLAAAGATMSDIVKVTCYLADLSFFPDYNQVWSEVFRTQPPARTTFQVGLYPPFRVELDVTAYRESPSTPVEG